MDCKQTGSLLHGYLDRELDAAGVMAVDEHLRSCTACSKALDQLSALQSAVRRQATYHAAPAGLTDRIRTGLRDASGVAPAKPDTPHRRWPQLGRWLQFGTAIAATAVITWTAALQLGGPSQDAAIAEQVITGHARSVLTGHLTDVATSDMHTVKPWLSSRLDFSPPVADLTGAGFPLIGGRLDYLDSRPVAVLVYRHRQHLINLFVWPAPKSGGKTAMQALSERGYNLLHWTDTGMTYWVISDLNPSDIKTFAVAYAHAE